MADEMRKALEVARNWIVNGSPQIGWNIDRLDAALAEQPAQDWSTGQVDADGEPLVTITRAEYDRLKQPAQGEAVAYEIELRQLRARAEAAEAACENLGVTPQQAAEGLARFKTREARIAELEARYAELCEAEPVAWCDTTTGDLEWEKTKWWTIPLIPRPSMEVEP